MKNIIITGLLIGLLAPVALAKPAREPNAPDASKPYRITIDHINDAVTQMLEEKDLADAITISFVGRHPAVLYEGENEPTAELELLNLDEDRKEWQARLTLSTDEKVMAPIELSGRYEPLAEVPTLSRRLHQGDVITREDIEWQPVPESKLRPSVIMQEKDLIGKTPLRPLYAGKPILTRDVTLPTIAKKGELLQLQFKSEFIDIRTMAVALQDGALGEIIKVKNADSNMILQAVITAPGKAEIAKLMQLSHDM